MSMFWTIWISVITLGSIFGFWWLLEANKKGTKTEGVDTPTTGHAYDGIEEYDNPLPRWWYYLFIITMVFALGYLALYPGLGSYKGLLGWTQEGAWEKSVARAEEKYAPIFAAYAETPVPELAQNTKAMLSAQRIFSNNCAVCHGSAARGAYGFPNLTDDDWLYGGTPEDIKKTLNLGRAGLMTPWGGVLGEEGVNQVAEYVMSLSGRNVNASLAAAGEPKFKMICAACHGPEGKGNQIMGAPNLTDDIWLYGGSPELIKHTIRNGRNGNMPRQLENLGEDKVHLMTAYVYSLSRKD